MLSGFEFRETMTGSYHLLSQPDVERPMTFTIRARSRKLLSFLKSPEMEIEGEIDAEGFADHRYLRGTLGLDLLRTKTIPYRFEFTANSGILHRFIGTKTLSARDLAESMTVLPGALITKDGEEVGRALLRFDLRSDLMRFLSSFRPLR